MIKCVMSHPFPVGKYLFAKPFPSIQATFLSGILVNVPNIESQSVSIIMLALPQTSQSDLNTWSVPLRKQFSDTPQVTLCELIIRKDEEDIERLATQLASKINREHHDSIALCHQSFKQLKEPLYLTESMPVGVVVVDQEGSIMFAYYGKASEKKWCQLLYIVDKICRSSTLSNTVFNDKIKSSLSQNRGKTALIVGATGLVGSLVLRQLLKKKTYKQIIVLSRRSLGVSDPILHEIITSFDALKEVTLPCTIHDVYCCLGWSVSNNRSGSYDSVDKEYVIETARLAQKNGAKQLAVISSVGSSKTSLSRYLKTKGYMEAVLSTIGFERLHIFRPSSILGYRKTIRWYEYPLKMILLGLQPILIGRLHKWQAIRADLIANAMIMAQTHELESKLFYKKDMQELYRLFSKK